MGTRHLFYGHRLCRKSYRLVFTIFHHQAPSRVLHAALSSASSPRSKGVPKEESSVRFMVKTSLPQWLPESGQFLGVPTSGKNNEAVHARLDRCYPLHPDLTVGPGIGYTGIC